MDQIHPAIRGVPIETEGLAWDFNEAGAAEAYAEERFISLCVQAEELGAAGHAVDDQALGIDGSESVGARERVQDAGLAIVELIHLGFASTSNRSARQRIWEFLSADIATLSNSVHEALPTLLAIMSAAARQPEFHEVVDALEQDASFGFLLCAECPASGYRRWVYGESFLEALTEVERQAADLP